MTALALMRRTAQRLADAGVPDADFDAMCLVEELCGIKPFALGHNIVPAPETLPLLEKAVARRIAGEPLQYLLGAWEFYGLPFFVGAGVLIPRPDTETLVDAALDALRTKANPAVLDLCSGSGCVAVAIAAHCKAATVTALERSDAAVSFLRRNIAANGVPVAVCVADALSRDTVAQFSGLSCITCNPPYLTAADMDVLQREVREEPEEALFGGVDGLAFYRALPALWKDSLQPGGVFAVEHGAGQETDVAACFAAAGYEHIRSIPDLTGTNRVVIAQK